MRLNISENPKATPMHQTRWFMQAMLGIDGGGDGTGIKGSQSTQWEWPCFVPANCRNENSQQEWKRRSAAADDRAVEKAKPIVHAFGCLGRERKDPGRPVDLGNVTPAQVLVEIHVGCQVDLVDDH